jgi:hypothetical protein
MRVDAREFAGGPTYVGETLANLARDALVACTRLSASEALELGVAEGRFSRSSRTKYRTTRPVGRPFMHRSDSLPLNGKPSAEFVGSDGAAMLNASLLRPRSAYRHLNPSRFRFFPTRNRQCQYAIFQRRFHLRRIEILADREGPSEVRRANLSMG